jgi:hypothetical protein
MNIIGLGRIDEEVKMNYLITFLNRIIFKQKPSILFVVYLKTLVQ